MVIDNIITAGAGKIETPVICYIAKAGFAVENPFFVVNYLFLDFFEGIGLFKLNFALK